ncbi:hypothetical protein TL16_g04754 [Triparma laevis f. inornata]|uniref:Uncharacterized protein n=2 Tax=Triparma laevis TaxID=1534972 RepID=A0A9W7AIE4_9STRA|nr:hypothetical protein TL16_g04754 [Triparma laevis f. inornata]GMH70485.1 hypothetical protein TrLO_g13832 [Triparma laevis f. longispina]
MAKLRRINQGLRTGLSDATSGWRSSILLSKQMTQKCEDLEASLEKLERVVERGREERSALGAEIARLKGEGEVVLKEYEELARSKEATISELEGSKEELRVEIGGLESSNEAAQEEIVNLKEQLEELMKERDDAKEELEHMSAQRGHGHGRGGGKKAGSRSSHSPLPPSHPPNSSSSSNNNNNLPIPPLPEGNSIHASIARSIALRFESAIRERIETKSMEEVKRIELAVGKAIEGISNEETKTTTKKKKKRGTHTTKKVGKKTQKKEINATSTRLRARNSKTR